MQMQPLLFTDEKSISPLSNNTNCSNCISIVCKWTQSEILQLPFGNSAIEILRDKAGGELLQPHSQVIAPTKHHGYPTFPVQRFSMGAIL